MRNPSTGKDSIKHIFPSKKDTNIKIAEDSATNITASLFFKTPDGISRMAVLGFFLSICASTILLKPMAADLAATIAMRINIRAENLNSYFCHARIIAERAKGRAKIVWENLIILP